MGPKNNYKINWATQKGISYSQFSIFNNCEYQWYLQYGKKIKVFKPTIHLIFGTAFHETLQEYIRVMYDKSAKFADTLDLSELLKERMIENYKISIEDNLGEHFTTQDEFKTFIEEGCVLLDWIKKKRSKFFSTRNSKLVGIEIPLQQSIIEGNNKILMIGSIDLVIYHKNTQTYTIYDIKTSTRGWNESDKRDSNKINQILLYKYFFAKEKKIPMDKISVEFFIVKRKPYENPDFPTHRVQEFIPANGTKKVEKAVSEFKSFIESCYSADGTLIDRTYKKNLYSCTYCPFANNPEMCSRQED